MLFQSDQETLTTPLWPLGLSHVKLLTFQTIYSLTSDALSIA